ncbi:hypothetical protein ZWY2020_049531 [Hordeum vulgare]|nr:hypothetical protein ZWY2020_049531 [Hordeum vulgare]
MDSAAAPPCHVLAVPYPGRGHVNAMLNLCRLLAARGRVSATVVVTEEWLGLLGSEPAPSGVRLEAIPNVVPSEHGRAADMVGFVEAVYTRMEAPFERLLDRLGAAPAAIVADTFVPWTVRVGDRRGVPVCVLSPLSATMFSVQYHFDRLPVAAGGTAPPVSDNSDGKDSCLIDSYIPGLKSVRLTDLEPTHSNKIVLNQIVEAYRHVRKAQCVIFTSFYELESDAIGSLRRELPCPVFAVGPCIPFMELHEHNAISEEEQGYMAWLDAQPVNSVLYVSLGSYLSVSSAQLDEIAMGLAQSNVKFLWVLRDAGSRMQDLQSESVADAVEKRSSHKWTGRGLPVPVSLLRRETEEFDIRHGLVPAPAPPNAPAPPDSPPPEFEEGSSSGTWTLSTTASSLYTPAREVAVDEDGFEIYDPAAFEGSVIREDFVPEEVLATVTGAVVARSAEEVEHDAKCRRREVDIDQLLLEQGLEQNRLHREQEATRVREKGKSVVIYVDDDSEEEGMHSGDGAAAPCELR